MKPTAVLFDLDGTLIDSIELIVRAAEHTLHGRNGYVFSEEDWIAEIGRPLATQLREFAADEAELAALIDSYRRYQREHHDRLTRCYDDVPATIEELRDRGHPMAVVTSKSDELARRSLRWVGLHDAMAEIISCDSCTRHKPEPEPVLLALERLGYDPDEAVFVGDSHHDIASGKAAGVTTIAALWGPVSREVLAAANPTHFLERIAGLPALLDRLPRGSTG